MGTRASVAGIVSLLVVDQIVGELLHRRAKRREAKYWLEKFDQDVADQRRRRQKDGGALT